MYVRTYLRTCAVAAYVRTRTYARTYVYAMGRDQGIRTYVHKGLKEMLRHIKNKKSLIFCNQGVHRSGNGACMLMCAANPNLQPCEAMLHLSRMRSISGLRQRDAYGNKASLYDWFTHGGPWAPRATFLTASPPPFPPLPATPLQLALFLPTASAPTASASRSPPGFPQPPCSRPSFSVRRRLGGVP